MVIIRKNLHPQFFSQCVPEYVYKSYVDLNENKKKQTKKRQFLDQLDQLLNLIFCWKECSKFPSLEITENQFISISTKLYRDHGRNSM